jgi:hypothetical protein
MAWLISIAPMNGMWAHGGLLCGTETDIEGLLSAIVHVVSFLR